MIKDLIYASPESQGLRSEDVLEFIKNVEYQKINMHSFLIARNGKIITEGYFKPFDKDFKHRIYSSTKTFVAVAIGVLIDQGVLTLKTKVASLLTPLIHTKVHKEVKNMTIEDCLKMSQPMEGAVISQPKDPRMWNVKNLNNVRVVKPSGSYFKYGAGANLLGTLIEIVTGGKTFIDVLRPIFEELGMDTDIKCVKDFQGYCWGGSGIVCTLRDFAKFGEFVLNKGNVNGKQLVSLSYMKKMTSHQVSAIFANNYTPLKDGYGYFTWISPDAVCFRGLGTQECFCFMKKGFLFCCQSETCGPNDVADTKVYDLVKLLLYDRISRVKKEGKAYKVLQEKLQNLNPPTYGKPTSKYESIINGKTYEIDFSEMGWKWFRFDFTKEGGTFTYENQRGVKTIKFNKDSLLQTTFPETHYYDWQAYVPANRELNCLTRLEWIDPNTALLRVHVVDIPLGSAFIKFGFKGNEVGVESSKTGEFILDGYGGYAYGKLKK